MSSVFEKISNRKPPKPAAWDCRRGTCRFCGASILREDGTVNTRKHWHQHCAEEWRIMNNPRDARQYVWHHFKGTCQGCGKNEWGYDDTWECDHVEPLFMAAGDPSYWSPENLTLLCKPCHTEKTKSDLELYRRVADKRNFKTSTGQ